MEEGMKDNGPMESNMVKENIYCLTDLLSMEFGKMERE